MRILVTGGTGYIGSHTCLELLEAGHEVIAIDNLSNSREESLQRVERITGKTLIFEKCDLSDKDKLTRILHQYQPFAVIHFAGLKAVGESVQNPLLYYKNNISGTAILLQAMDDTNISNIVFSSSCTVYGTHGRPPIDENTRLEAVNPYGQTKLTIEYMLKDVWCSNPAWNVSILRYFNPVGAHHSGEIGEDPLGPPRNLMPAITQVAVGQRKELLVFGDDYPTRDGSCIRDYIHVVDLARGHINAVENLTTNPGTIIHNLGTGTGYSVLEMIRAFAQVTGQNVPFKVVGRRPGDAPEIYANPDKAHQELGWRAKLGLEQMCEDAWRWQTRNPEGYK